MARYLLIHNVMKTPIKYILSIAALTAALTLSARANFVKDDNPGGVKIFFDVAHDDTNDFEGFVGANNPNTHHVRIQTVGHVSTGSGFSNIKPVHGTDLTQLIFTPDDPNTFANFSFRGQLEGDANGMVSLTVVDNLGNSQTFMFTVGNGDFLRRGIISTDGETIQSVTITSHFKEFKQVEISFAPEGGVPDGGTTVMLLGAALSVLGLARRYLKS
jgi:hypothetical protein